MSLSKPEAYKRRWLAPEVVQTSAMDCGPASLKCLLEGFHIPVSYGRLREACQTSVDGTSIDKLEEVANQLGVNAEQIMIPVDHIFLTEANVLPAMVVVRHADGATHFVVAWRRHGKWLQIMDPAVGRRWVTCQRFKEDIFRHVFPVDAEQWFEWASTEEFLNPLGQQLTQIGTTREKASGLIGQAVNNNNWFELATLDASTRLVKSIIDAKGLKPGKQAVNLVETLMKEVNQGNILKTIPRPYWSVVPDNTTNRDDQKLMLTGAVLLRIKAKLVEDSNESEPLSPELSAALQEKPDNAFKTLLSILKTDGILAPFALFGAIIISIVALLIETLLFRGTFDIAWQLKLADQRLAALAALIVFVALLSMIEIPIKMESLRYGRQLETRLRMALLKKLPQLSDRYFQSRPISDMAERSHSIALTRLVPGLGIYFVQTVWDILFTLIGVILIDPASSFLALVVTIIAIVLPLLAQPLINERDLRVRNHSGALFTFYLDALLGLVPIRAHCAERSVRREHEGLLVEWARSSKGLIQYSLAIEGLQSLICIGLVGFLLWLHFVRSGNISGGDLLLIYWTLKLPALGHTLTTLAHQYPAQRNILLRLLEPLATPEEHDGQNKNEALHHVFTDNNNKAVNIAITEGNVVAAGHSILQGINLTIDSGEHIAIVGPSGAGKSSFVGLLLGWHRLESGQLHVDGKALTGSYQQDLRRETAWVDPAVQIWNRSFLDNLKYSNHDTDINNLAKVINTALLRGVLQKLPSGLQTYLGEGGALLSGGEGQRVRLARALMQTDVRLVLLDEPFRGMDRDHRHQLMKEARHWWKDATLLCVTHDIEETQSFKRVLVVEDGQIIEDDEPGNLMTKNSRYRQLLEAENMVRQDLWKGKVWRRLQIQDGFVQSLSEASHE
jgi:ATP-binding cassette subfamily B protein